MGHKKNNEEELKMKCEIIDTDNGRYCTTHGVFLTLDEDFGLVCPLTRDNKTELLLYDPVDYHYTGIHS